MITFEIYPQNLSKLEAICEQQNCYVSVGKERTIRGFRGHPLFKVVAVAVESKSNTSDRAKLLAVVNDRQNVHRLDPAYDYAKIELGNVDLKKCDKCGVKHNRRKVFIVRLSDGSELQVGGQCAQELDCETRVKKIMKDLLKVERKLNSDRSNIVYRGEKVISAFEVDELDELFRLTAAHVRKNGYKSKSHSPYDNTAEDLHRYYQVGRVYVEESGEYQEVTAESQKARREALIQSQLTVEEQDEFYWFDRVSNFLVEQEDSDYILNARIAMAHLDKFKWNMLVSIPATIVDRERRAAWKQAQAVKNANVVKPSNGDKLKNLEAVIEKKTEKETDYGLATDFTIFSETYGKIWFRSTAGWVGDVKEGDKIRGNFTIREVKPNISFARGPRKIEVVQKMTVH